MNVSRTSRWFLIVLLTAAALSCSSQKPAALNLLPGKAKPLTNDSEAERLRKMQLITLIDTQKNNEPSTVTNGYFQELVLSSCGGSDCTAPTDCTQACDAMTTMCQAQTYLALTRPQGQMVTLVGHYSVPMQSEAARQSIAELGLDSAVSAGRTFYQILRYATGLDTDSTDPVCGNGAETVNGTPLATYAGAGLAQAFDIYKQLSDAAVTAAVNTADAELNSSPSIQQAAVRALTERLQAAKHIGGEASQLPFDSGAFCTAPPATPAVKAAIAIIRDAAPAPADVLSTAITTSTLIEDTGSGVPSGSVRQRLAQIYYGTPDLPAGNTVEQLNSLDMQAFEGARALLKQELVAFARSGTAKLNKRTKPDGTLSADNSYAATAAPPARLPAAYYGALARVNNGVFGLGTLDESDDPTAPWTGYNSRFEGFVRAANTIIAASDNPESTVDGVAIGPLGLMVAAHEFQGRVVTIPIFNEQGYGGIAVQVDGFVPADGIKLAIGEDALRCAVQGSVEGGADVPGATCSLAGLVAFSDEGFNITQAILGIQTQHAYLLKPHTAPAANPQDILPPGSYDALIGFTVSVDGGSDRGGFAIVRGSEERLAALLEPSRDWCARPRVSCNHVPFDERIPLQNELSSVSSGTSNSTGVDASWKHYLDLATAAATEADALGNDYISSALAQSQNQVGNEDKAEQQRQQASSQLQQLQALCGTNISVDSLLKAESDGNGNFVANGGNCSDGCLAGFRCIDPGGYAGSGHCTFDIDAFVQNALPNVAADPDVQRLRDCLSGGAIVPFVSLGDRPLCVWWQRNNHNLVCKVPDPATGALVDAPLGTCPMVLPADKDLGPDQQDASCNAILTTRPRSPDTTTQAKASQPLHYFTASTDSTNAAGDVAAWSLVRDLTPLHPSVDLMHHTSAYEVQRIIDANILDPIRLGPIQSGIDFEARADGYAAITFFGRTLYESGSVTGGPSSNWPCSNVDVPWGGLAGSPSYNCATAPGLHQARTALLNAATAIILMSPLPGALESASSNAWYVPLGTMSHPSALSDPAACGGPCTSSRTLVRPDHTALLEETCPKGTLYLGNNGVAQTCLRADKRVVQGRTFENFALSGGGSVIELERSAQSGSKYALSGLSKFNGGSGWLSRYVNGQASLSDVIDTFTLDPTKADDSPSITGLDIMTAAGILAKAATAPAMIPVDSLPKPIKSVDDLGNASRYIQHMADQIRATVGGLSFANMPQTVTDALRSESAAGSYPQFGGDMAIQISTARSALLRIHENGPLIANEVAQIGAEIDGLRAVLEKSTIRQKLDHLQFLSTFDDRMAQCGEAIAHAAETSFSITKEATSLGGAGAAAALGAFITCANSVAQINIASQIQALQGQDAQLDSDIALADFDGKFAAHATQLQTLGLRLTESEDDLDSALANIESNRAKAKTALTNAISASSFQAQGQALLTTTLGNLTDGKQIRYQTAFANAQNLAFLAKRAVEQRLGLRLAEITEKYPLVDAPSTWEATVCEYTGIDYSKLTLPNAPVSYANGFIGDYVKKLSNFIESYTLQNNFHEGTDTAVISLRDDIMGVRKPCPTTGPNLLYNAGQLNQGLQPGWGREGCPATVVDGVPQPLSECLDITPLTKPDGSQDFPLFGDNGQAKTVGYDLKFGVNSSSTSAAIQSVVVKEGLYRLTWYTKESGTSGGAAAGLVRDLAPNCNVPTQPICQVESGVESTTATNGWFRRYVLFRVASPQTIRVGFGKVAGTVTVSAPMLEHLADIDTDQALKAFANTTDTLTVQNPGCEDSDGTVFRSTRWNRTCMNLCTDGFASHCAAGSSKSYCYWETQFGFSQRDIQLGKIFNFSGFARGNFNYRMDTVGINFVGTGTRDCSGSSSPQTCSGGGYIPYTLSHTGPFFVRNHKGDDVETMLFDGNIEHARGLALERYLTNPVSSSDQGLLNQYLRTEFSGRPLDGNFVLRVWDEGGVDFNSIQDVQLVMNYRYWTKFD